MNTNMMNSMMNTNMLGIMSMRNDVSIYQILWGIVLMNLMGFLPTIKNIINRYIQKKFKKTKKNIEDTFHTKDVLGKEIKSSICFSKKKDNNDTDIIFNSINYHIINNNNSKFLHYNNDFSVINNDEFQINENVFCHVKNEITADEESEYIITIFSYNLELVDLKKFIDEIKQKYMYEQKNKLGMQKFYFDEKPITLPLDQEKNIRYDMAPKDLNFTMTPFHTNKSLTNIFGRHLKDLKERVNMFLNNKEWYIQKGVPYTLGVMLHGPPGTGKTSIIKAIAKDSKRHVFNIKFKRDTTQTQVRNLFFNEKVNVVQNGRTETFNIPINERIYVIEDIDCLTDIFNERKDEDTTHKDNDTQNDCNDYFNDNMLMRNNVSIPQSYSDFTVSNYSTINNKNMISDVKNNIEPKKFKQNINPHSAGEELNLSFMLNILDGILETPGRILIVTSNHPKKLDKAFIRPGRIDVNLEVGYCDEQMITDMFSYFYDRDCTEMFTHFEYIKKVTPAEVNKIILNNYNKPKNAYRELLSLI